MQSAASIDRFRPPIAIRVVNKFGAMFNGKVSRCLSPDDLIETAKRRTGLHDFGDGDFREPLARLLESCWRDARLNGFDLLRGRTQPLLTFGAGAQNDRHGFGMHRPHEIVGVCGQEAEQKMRADIRLLFRAIVA